MNDLREQCNADLTAARRARRAGDLSEAWRPLEDLPGRLECIRTGGDGVSVVQPATAVASISTARPAWWRVRL